MAPWKVEFKDMDGDQNLFKLRQGILSLHVNGQLEIQNVKMVVVKGRSLRIQGLAVGALAARHKGCLAIDVPFEQLEKIDNVLNLYQQATEALKRPKLGELVLVVHGPFMGDQGRLHIGKEGIILEDDGSDQPYRVSGMEGDNLWFHESSVQKVEANKSSSSSDIGCSYLVSPRASLTPSTDDDGSKSQAFSFVTSKSATPLMSSAASDISLSPALQELLSPAVQELTSRLAAVARCSEEQEDAVFRRDLQISQLETVACRERFGHTAAQLRWVAPGTSECARSDRSDQESASSLVAPESPGRVAAKLLEEFLPDSGDILAGAGRNHGADPFTVDEGSKNVHDMLEHRDALRQALTRIEEELARHDNDHTIFGSESPSSSHTTIFDS